KRFHFSLAIFANRRFINFKIQLSLVKDAEESLVPIEPVATKHAPRVDAVQVLQLIQNKILERFVPRSHSAFPVPERLERFERLERLEPSYYPTASPITPTTIAPAPSKRR